MVWTPAQNGRQSLDEGDLPVDTARQKEKRKTATIMEESSDEMHEKLKHGRSQTDLFSVWEWTDGS